MKCGLLGTIQMFYCIDYPVIMCDIKQENWTQSCYFYINQMEFFGHNTSFTF